MASLVQFLKRSAGGAILGGEQTVEAVADDLVGAVAEDSFRAGVPGVDATRVVHREDGVIEGAVDEEAEAFLAGGAAELGLAARGHVLEHQDDAVDAIVDGAVRTDPHHVPAAVDRLDFPVDAVQLAQHLVHVAIDLVVAQAMGDIRKRPADVGMEHVEEVAGARRRQLHAQSCGRGRSWRCRSS